MKNNTIFICVRHLEPIMSGCSYDDVIRTAHQNVLEGRAWTVSGVSSKQKKSHDFFIFAMNYVFNWKILP